MGGKHAAADVAPTPAEPVVEHAVQMAGGVMHVRAGGAWLEDVYPLAEWIHDVQRFGGKVYRRTVIVVDDWQEVPPA